MRIANVSSPGDVRRGPETVGRAFVRTDGRWADRVESGNPPPPLHFRWNDGTGGRGEGSLTVGTFISTELKQYPHD